MLFFINSDYQLLVVDPKLRLKKIKKAAICNNMCSYDYNDFRFEISNNFESLFQLNDEKILSKLWKCLRVLVLVLKKKVPRSRKGNYRCILNEAIIEV